MNIHINIIKQVHFAFRVSLFKSYKIRITHRASGHLFTQLFTAHPDAAMTPKFKANRRFY
jgi:hypothetical protein